MSYQNQTLPNGFVLLQVNPDYAWSTENNWLYYKHPDGQWVTYRKLEPWEVMQAEDQRLYGIVQDGKSRSQP